MPSRVLRGLFAAALLCGAVPASAAIFEPLFMVTKAVGDVRIVKPGGQTELVRVDHAYPYGSRLIVPKEIDPEILSAARSKGIEPESPQVVVSLARDYMFRFDAGTDVTILDQSTGTGEGRSEVKVLDLACGSLNTYITAVTKKSGTSLDHQADANLAAIVVQTPVGQCQRMSQRNKIKVERDPLAPGMYRCQFATQSGVMEIVGPQYKIEKIKRNSVVEINGNDEFTGIVSSYGEFVVTIEKGADAEEKVFFKSRCLAKIWRQHAEVGERLAVAVMVAYPDGRRTQYAYLEGQEGVDLQRSSAEAVTGQNAVVGTEGASGGESGFGDGETDGSDFGDGGFGGESFEGSDSGYSESSEEEMDFNWNF